MWREDQSFSNNIHNLCTLTTDDFSCSVDKCRILVEGLLVSKRVLSSSALTALALLEELDLLSLLVGAAQTCIALHRQ